MIISDLNYLEVATEEVVGGFFIVPNRISVEVSNIKVYERFDIDKKVISNAIVSGNLSAVQANVVGFNNSLTQATTYVAPGLNSATALSAGN